MRTFKCYGCGHKWQLRHGEGGRGVDLTCPECGSENVHREDVRSMEDEQHWDRHGRRHHGRRHHSGGGKRR